MALMSVSAKPNGHGSKSKARTPSEHPNPTTKIGSKMGGEFTYQPKWDPIGFDPQPNGYPHSGFLSTQQL